MDSGGGGGCYFEQLFRAEHDVPHITFDGQGPPRGEKLERVVGMVCDHHEFFQGRAPYDAVIRQGDVRNMKDDVFSVLVVLRAEGHQKFNLPHGWVAPWFTPKNNPVGPN